MSSQAKKLIFVYNGDSGLINGVMHYLHKRISPDTYPCQLCGIIYDGTSLNKGWLAFIQSLGVPTEYLHRDEYQRQYGKSSMVWPAVLLHEGKQLKATVLSAKDFEEIPSLDVLQSRLTDFVRLEFSNINAV